MANYVVRRAAAADMEAIKFIWQETSDMLGRMDSRLKPAPEAVSRWEKMVTEWLDRKDVAIFVADRGDKVIGYIVGYTVANLPTLLPERYGYISDLAVDSHGKAGGIGRALFDALKEWFAAEKVTHVEARVPHRHSIAQAFWRALGATELYDQMWIKLD